MRYQKACKNTWQALLICNHTIWWFCVVFIPLPTYPLFFHQLKVFQIKHIITANFYYTVQLPFWLTAIPQHLMHIHNNGDFDSNEQSVSFFNSDLNSVCIFLTIENALSQSALLLGRTKRALANFDNTLNRFLSLKMSSTVDITPQNALLGPRSLPFIHLNSDSQSFW